MSTSTPASDSGVPSRWQQMETAPIGGTVLVWVPWPWNGIFVAERLSGEWKATLGDCLARDDGDETVTLKPTHWQPLPAPPEE